MSGKDAQPVKFGLNREEVSNSWLDWREKLWGKRLPFQFSTTHRAAFMTALRYEANPISGKGELMGRDAWLEKMRKMTEALYDHISPEYWVNFGFYVNETHMVFLRKFLDCIAPYCALLSAACGAGRYDGMLLEAGHDVTGIDQSEGMLERAREHFPQVKYVRMSLQDLDFLEAFDGVICVDAMENVCPEDWPEIMANFCKTLKPGGLLYFTAELYNSEALKASYERARAMGLPVVFGELGDEVERSYERVMSLTPPGIPGDLAGLAVYHYYPSMDQIRVWIDQAGFTLEEEGMGNDYAHFLVRKRD